ncbi:MAG: lytic transglycosylase domain-containing protein [Zymomonas mobilis subsp. pomaceae]|uniref:Lytic transglycosylase catalytic n=1 Tax=Zymomonas mobilis subsp. pomaceae (strain ATCC 29192 / DSM 22645 / JCM 10191 / CCUG 17912 / NBRC 13757 / NCIMB 11200 / NRRL B-4491 / Barker I) TaxID=579138 RepID=F8EVU5_ZYMMT|nr:lytic transglycosylase domain-containing protein [Zymomonas mobilis]AEI37422.1 Lytic transglycosylase catalytic [Zymomonas mobilis subsp. pomaceae ATCC 29192]MDX5948789.1 lytic transglycosylase domain-containing protein [Zymomonas mobilis subsp. pomaceae]GEB88597.1 hypothetical protein ZMO02_02340 [Zymomonas mobilis subsp. pomaceae]
MAHNQTLLSSDKDVKPLLSRQLKRRIQFLALFASFIPASLFLSDQTYGQRNSIAIVNQPAVTDSKIAKWQTLRSGTSLSFQDYASFLIENPHWPAENILRHSAEKTLTDGLIAMGEKPQSAIRFFEIYPPTTNSGRAAYALILAAYGQQAEAIKQAKWAWTEGYLPLDIENALLTRFNNAFTSQEQALREDRLLWSHNIDAARLQLSRVPEDQKPAFETRIALQSAAPESESLLAALGTNADDDPGMLADHVLYLRAQSRPFDARNLLAASRKWQHPPLDAGEWLNLLLTFAQATANDKQYAQTLAIVRQVFSAFSDGTKVKDQSFTIRDRYTDLLFLGGRTALKHLGQPQEALALFSHYAAASKSPQSRSRGYYWAARSALAMQDKGAARHYLMLAARAPDQFYGQLSLEILGQDVPIPPYAPALPDQQRQNLFYGTSLTQASIRLGQQQNWRDQSIFLRALANALKQPEEYALATDLSLRIGRPDLAVMASRSMRNSDLISYNRSGYPSYSLPVESQPSWVMVHALSRQESQFDRHAKSSVGALGLMQLMPKTAKDQAQKLGLSYDPARLVDDPSYNLTLGASFYERMRRYYQGSHLLAVAAYNAGPGNVNRYLSSYGDPRLANVDVIDWIEDFPLDETRNYIQRVLENAVVYSRIDPDTNRSRVGGQALSDYLGGMNHIGPTLSQSQ